jgi:hypothetical protein
MNKEALEKIRHDVLAELANGTTQQFAIIGHTAAAYEIRGMLLAVGAADKLAGIFSATGSEENSKRFTELPSHAIDVAIIASDVDKESVLRAVEPYLQPCTRVIVAGYEHLKFRNEVFDDVVRNALVPSLANGYPNSLTHIFQCLQTAARLGLEGVVAEFGIFKGGTTMMLSQFVEKLGQSWKVIGFDTFGGFPEKRSLFDMYAHPDCVFSDEQAVRRYLDSRDVELVKGDVIETVERLNDEDLILAFFDTDNFSSTSAILDVVLDRVVVGGSLIFDHFTGVDRFRYTLGERMAASRLLDDTRFFHLHDTGVFFRHR